MSAPDGDPAYRIFLRRRMRLGGRLYRVGEIVNVSGDTALRMVAHTCARGDARPADERTKLDVELLNRLLGRR